MNSLNDYALSYVRSEIKEHEEILKTTSYWKSYDFAFISYSISALKEILSRLEKDRVTSPITIIREYRDQMSDYACVNPEGSFMFSVACDMAVYMLDELTVRR